MWRGANNGVRVVVDGEVHVERVEKIEAVAVDGRPPASSCHRRARPAPDVNELAEEFIRRNMAAFQRGIGDHRQRP
ncbi:hypothetical protein HU200_000016 [Digitaria exilis]|uniref:Uncharacterized protein n=1 Tax=Digitaria exilis TaxID=1010633 RepID=A0A835KVZ1_9POAL|nr:hypothetical protein HU200_000016 [Digitaria exilis]